MINIENFTICLHCGCSRDVVNNQIELLKPLENEYNIFWNNRIDRHPEIYDSYSELINESVATSKTEWIILINDRTLPKPEEVKKIIKLLSEGFSCVLLYNVGFMGFSKQLIRTIGWWDQRFTNGGWEDRDWVWRLRLKDLAIYESLEATYDMSWKSPLNIPGAVLSGKFWEQKYRVTESDFIYKLLPEEKYENWDSLIGSDIPEIGQSWKKWPDSVLNIMYNQKDRPRSGPSGSSLLNNRQIIDCWQ